jgi:hypothetical protein
LKIYLSYPMRIIAPQDLDARRELLQSVQYDRWIDSFHSPETIDPALPLKEIQDLDFEEMRPCYGVLLVWSRSSHLSSGIVAEVEWARRIFNIPVVIWRSYARRPISPWIAANVGGMAHRDLEGALRMLEWQALLVKRAKEGHSVTMSETTRK